ncbi:MAG: UbiA prenyltransferase family protein [Gaiellaceae bacterium]
MTTAEPARVVELRPRRSRSRAALVSLRPRQWSKNLLLFAGIVFAAELGDAVRWGEAAAIFVAYCAASSAAYLVNDLRDAEDDRLHPVKRYRPIARGELQPEHALVLAAVLAAGALAIAAALGFASLLLLLAFIALQLGYSLGLKRIVFVDVVVIAGLFVIRAAAGAAAVDVPISGWLLVCTALLALFLGLAKRRGELVLVDADETPGRPALAGYSSGLVDVLLNGVAAATAAAYAVYAVAAHTPWMVLTVPFVVAGLGRYLFLVHRHDLGEEPEHVLLSDRVVLGAVAGWAIVSAVVLAVA